MQILRGILLLLLAPAIAAAQMVGPPADVGAGYDAPPRPPLRAQHATASSTAPSEALPEAVADTAADQAQSVLQSQSQPRAQTGQPASPSTESLPLGAPAAAGSGAGSPQTAGTGRLGVGRTVISLAAVVALIALLAAACRQWASSRGGLAMAMGAGGRAPSGVLEILGRYPISRGMTLVLLKIDRRVLLLAQTRTGRLGTGTSLRALCELSDPEEVASVLGRCRDEAGESLAGKFRSMLGQFEATNEELDGLDGEEPLRLVEFSADGDRVELWDTGEEVASDLMPDSMWDQRDPYAQRGVG